MHSIERSARRRGGPLDTTFVTTTCPTCAQAVETPIRALTRKSAPCCPLCRGKLDQEHLSRGARDMVRTTAQALKEALSIHEDRGYEQ